MKLNELFGSISIFRDIEKVITAKDSFTIIEKNGVEKIFETKFIMKGDVDKLLEIISKHIDT